MNGPAGVVSCTSNVAALLPAGSYIIAVDATVSGVPGAFTKILKNNWHGEATDPAEPTSWTTLQIKPGEFATNDIMRLWVFPPAILSGPPTGTPREMDVYPKRGNVQFEPVSPVIDVVQKKVVAG